MAITSIIRFTDDLVSVLVADTGKVRTIIKFAKQFPIVKAETDDETNQQIAQTLKDAMKAANIHGAISVRIILPKNDVLLRKLTLPSTEDEELIDMAKFEVERQIPINADKQTIGFTVLSKNGMSGSDVILASADNTLVSRYVNIVIKAGLVVEAVLISPLNVYNCIKTNVKDLNELEAALILNIDYDDADISVVMNGNIIFTRSSGWTLKRLAEEMLQHNVPEALTKFGELDAFGIMTEVTDAESDMLEKTCTLDSQYYPFSSVTNEIPAAETDPHGAQKFILDKWLQGLVIDIRRTSDFARREYEIPVPSKLYITGEGACINRLVAYMKSKLSIDSEVFDPYKFCDDKDNVIASPEERLKYSMLICGSINLQPGVTSVNLLPQEYIAAGRRIKQRKSWLITGILTLILLLVGYLYIDNQFAIKDEKLQLYTQQNKQMKSEVEDLLNKDKRLKIIKAFTQDEQGALKILEILSSSKMIPNDVTLSNFEYKKGDYVKLKGYARSIPAINNFRNELLSTNFFEKVEDEAGSQAEVTLPNRDKKVYEYALTSTFRQNTKTTGKKTEK